MSDATSGGAGEQRYRLDTRIATGGMGEVWRATDLVLGREVALKLLKAEFAGDATFRSRFETEARNAAALHHPNVASIFDFGELPDTDGGGRRPYLVMELVRGEPLSALLRGGERMPSETAANLLAQAADGLAAAHDLGIVHRDVKPANLLVTPDRVVKITDFGIARAADAVALTQTGQVIGTPQYLSPEQAEGRQSTGASDIYSLGVVLYECLAGRRPFEGDSPIATALAHIRHAPPPLPDDVPEQLREVVAIALAKDPGARFGSVRDFSSALRGGPVRAGVDAPTSAMTGAVIEDDQATRVQEPVPPVDTAVPAATARAGEIPRTIAPPPGGSDRSRRRLPGWLPWLVALVAVVAAVVVALQLAGSTGDGSPGPSSSTSGTAGPSSSTSPTQTQSSSPTASATGKQVNIVASRYVGRPEAEVEADLEELALNWRRVRVDNPGDQDEGTVAAVSPTGRVDVGTRITISVYDVPKTPPTPTTSASASESASPTASPTATPDDDGGGNGGDGGNGEGPQP